VRKCNNNIFVSGKKTLNQRRNVNVSDGKPTVCGDMDIYFKLFCLYVCS
jgi:hypothetical protein